jgi:hypothetical protein
MRGLLLTNKTPDGPIRGSAADQGVRPTVLKVRT